VLLGKSLVVMDAERGLLIDVFPCEDAYTQERLLVYKVLPTIKKDELWLADRNFCWRALMPAMHFFCSACIAACR
jgi:hypothetical protein